MRTFTLQQSRTEVYTPNGGLALVGHCLNRHTSLTKTARTVVKRHGIPNIELIRTYLGLITLGKSDFEAAEPVRTDPFFKSALGIKQSPSSARLRQRFDEDAQGLTPLLDDASVEFLQSVEAPVSPLRWATLRWIWMSFPWTTARPIRRVSATPTRATTVMHRWPPTWGRKAGAWVASCALAASTPTRDFSIPSNGCYPGLDH